MPIGSSERKGFFSIDAFFALMLLLTISMMLLGLANERKEAAKTSSASQEADIIAEKLAASVNSVYANGENIELRISLPSTIENESYEVDFDPDNRRVKVSSPFMESPSYAAAPVAPKNVEFGAHVPAREVVIKWEKKTVKVEKI